MNTLGKALIRSLAVASALTAVSVTAETSLTVGAVSDYYFRGSHLGDAGAYASVDYQRAGFSGGVWAIDDGGTNADDEDIAGGDGLEVDFYLGYGGEYQGFSYGVGYTRYEYTYTGDFEHEYEITFGIAGFGLEYVDGVAEADVPNGSDEEQDYDVISLSWAGEVVAVTVAEVSTDDIDNGNEGQSDYRYAEVSASKELSGFAFTATAGTVFDGEIDGMNAESGDGYIVLDVSKIFDLSSI